MLVYQGGQAGQILETESTLVVISRSLQVFDFHHVVLDQLRFYPKIGFFISAELLFKIFQLSRDSVVVFLFPPPFFHNLPCCGAVGIIFCANDTWEESPLISLEQLILPLLDDADFNVLIFFWLSLC